MDIKNVELFMQPEIIIHRTNGGFKFQKISELPTLSPLYKKKLEAMYDKANEAARYAYYAAEDESLPFPVYDAIWKAADRMDAYRRKLDYLIEAIDDAAEAWDKLTENLLFIFDECHDITLKNI